MQTITPFQIQDKKVLLRLDLDVPLKKPTADSSPTTAFDRAVSRKQKAGSIQVAEDFRLRMGLPTLRLCLQHAAEVIIMGHLGRPSFVKTTEGKPVEPDGNSRKELSVAPIYDWLFEQGFSSHLESGKVKLLENLRFEEGEGSCNLDYAKELAALGDIYINEAFAAYHQAASTTVLPTLLPHLAGLRFAEEVKVLSKVRENPQRPLVVIIGGAKVGDKLPVVEAMAKIADFVLVGGKIIQQFPISNFQFSQKIRLGGLREDGLDITEETLKEWDKIIKAAGMIVWNGPVGKTQNSNFKTQNWEEMDSEKGTYRLAKMIIDSGVESIVGGGDTVGFLSQVGMMNKFGFVSTGGGAMLKFLSEGTLPTIKTLD